MPKQRHTTKGSKIKYNVLRKFRIGTRKSGQSANLLSVPKLQELLVSSITRGRDMFKIQTVLDRKLAAL